MSNPYTRAFNTQETPQSEKIPGSNQVENSAGGYSFQVDDWQRLDRFLILGTEGGSYYASERALTKENCNVVLRCIKANGDRVLKAIVDISDSGRAPKNDAAIFALAMCLKLGDESTRLNAGHVAPRVIRTSTHLFALANAVDALGGWGKNTRHVFAEWYNRQNPESLAYQLVKYRNREGWTHRDILRKCHVDVPSRQVEQSLLRWAVGKPLGERTVLRRQQKAPHEVLRVQKYPACSALPATVLGFEELQKATTVNEAVKLIIDYKLPRECVPTELLGSPNVWEALLHSGEYGMPPHAMLRNLGKMASVGLLNPFSAAEGYILGRLMNVADLKRARVHPIAILMAQSVYAKGHGVKGKLTWTPSQLIVDRLNDAFHGSFSAVVPTDKRTFLALDVSSSMDGGQVAGTFLTPRQASVAMALVTARTEPRYFMGCFSTAFTRLEMTKDATIYQAAEAMQRIPYGGTDCALPMLYALKNRIEADTFIIYTDSETWAGTVHPVQALKKYRAETGIDAKLVVVGMVSNQFSIADPSDGGMLDVVGFDTSAPQVIADFARQ